jgi:hypothetical protein
MSGVEAQGDPCTATIFWSIVPSHVLYSSSSPVPPTMYSTLHKNVYLSNDIWIQLKRSFFPCRFLVIHISSTRTGKLNSHHQQSPMPVECIHTTGCCPVPRRDHLRHCYPPQCHAAFGTMPHILASVNHSPVCRPRTLPSSAMRTPMFGFWTGCMALRRAVYGSWKRKE